MSSAKESSQFLFILSFTLLFAIIFATVSVIDDKKVTVVVAAADSVVTRGESREFYLRPSSFGSNPAAAAAVVSARQDDYDDYFEDSDTVDDSTDGHGIARLLNDDDIQESRSEKLVLLQNETPSSDNDDNELGPGTGQMSLVIVFDGTSSMFDDLQQLRAGATAIIREVNQRSNHPIYNYVFVPFRDPAAGPKLVTRNQTLFLETIASLELFGGGDCPESSLKGIEMGLESALPKSVVFVFTDAVANDFLLEPSVLQLIQEKQASVNFLLSGFCDSKGSPGYNVYERIAEASNGQVFDLKKSDIGEVMKEMREFLDLHNVPLKTLKNPKGVNPPIELTVDNNIKMFSVSVSGTRPEIIVANDGNLNQETKSVFSTENLEIVKVTNPERGTWNVRTSADSESVVRVMAISELILEFGFSANPLEFFNQSSFTPTLGVKNILSIRALNTKHLKELFMVHIGFAEKHNLRDFILPLKYNETSRLFVTEPFEPPRSPFQISVQGFDSEGNAVNRILSTEIKASIGSPPDVLFDEESQTIFVGTALKLSCRIRSFGVASSLILQNEKQILKIQFSDSDPEITHEKMAELTDNGVYSCSGKNEFGTRVKTMKLNVLPKPPQLELIGKAIEGEDIIELRCSPLEHEKVFWNLNGTEIESVLERNSIEFRGNDLILRRIHRKMSGNYSCIVDDPVILQIDVKYPVERSGSRWDTNTTIFGKGEIVNIPCKLIGNPMPKIVWINRGSLPVNDRNELIINTAVEEVNGRTFQCSGINEVTKSPVSYEINLIETLEIKQQSDSILEGDDIILECNIPPNAVRVDWTVNSLPAESLGSLIKDDGRKFVLRNVTRKEDNLSVSCIVSGPFGRLMTSKKIPVLRKLQKPPVTEKIPTWGKNINTVNLDPVQPNKEPKKLRQDFVLVPGESVTIDCLGNSSEWSKDGIWMNYPRRQKLMGIPENEGIYTCSNWDENGENEIEYHVVYKQPPEITFITNSSTTNTLDCKATGYPIPVISWLHQGSKVISTTLVQYGDEKFLKMLNSGESILIDTDGHGFPMNTNFNVNIRDTAHGILSQRNGETSFTWFLPENLSKTDGEWTCVALNKWGTTNRTITISESIETESEPENLAIVQGLPLILECNPLNLISNRVEWTKNKEQIGVDDPRTILRDRNNTFIILETRSSDSGTFECVITSSHMKFQQQQMRRKFHVFILEPPQVTSGTSSSSSHADESIFKVSIARGQSTTLFCPITGTPEPIIFWTQRFMTSSFSEPLIGHERNLTIHPKDPVEYYQCSASSSMGNSQVLFEVNMEYGPSIKNTNSVSLTPKLFSSILLPCWTDGIPRPNITWYRNTRVLTPSLRMRLSANDQVIRISNIRSDDNGVYSCVARNYLGTSSKTFTVQVSVPTILSPWSRWSNCSQPCGLGTRQRTRECWFWNGDTMSTNNTPKCVGEKLETEECLITECPVDGEWSSWTPWSPCSTSCKSYGIPENTPSVRYRHRDCSNPSPSFGGTYCKGSSYQQEICEVPFCPIDGGWSEFSNWSACSVSCGDSGAVGMQVRNRMCNSPVPQFNGRDCSGQSFEVRHCNNDVVSCASPAAVVITTTPMPSVPTAIMLPTTTWSEWSEWSECTAICGSGLRSRTRKCQNSGGGGFTGVGDCVGENIEFQQCEGSRCDERFKEQTHQWYYFKPDHRPQKLQNFQHGITKVQASASISSSSEEEPQQQHQQREFEEDVGGGETMESSSHEGGAEPQRFSLYPSSTVSRNNFFYDQQPRVSITLESSIPLANDVSQIHFAAGPTSSQSTPPVQNTSCELGFHFQNGFCDDINECAHEPSVCSSSQICVNSRGGFSCECDSGYEMFEDAQKCVDIDECARREHDCSHQCVNTPGAYTCDCPEGFVLAEDFQTCVEAELGKLELRNVPEHSPVYYVDIDHCSDGFAFVNGQCEDVDECVAWEENCAADQRCLNTRGSFLCIPIGCPENFNETDDSPGVCYESCNNTYHSCSNGAQVANRLTYVVRRLEKFDSETPVHKLIGYDLHRRPLVDTVFNLQYNPENNHIFHLKQWRQGIALVFARELQEEKLHKVVAFGRTVDAKTKELLYLHKFIIYLYR